MGLINEDEAQDQPQPQTDVLAKLQAAAEQNVPQQYQDAYQRVVLAGKKLMYSDETHDLMQQALAQSDDPMQAVGKGTAQLMGLLTKESRNTIPQPVFMPAALALMADALDFVSQTKKRRLGPQDIETATRSFSETLLAAAGITQDGLGQLVGKTEEMMANPESRALIEQRLGGMSGGMTEGA